MKFIAFMFLMTAATMVCHVMDGDAFFSAVAGVGTGGWFCIFFYELRKLAE